MSAGFFAQIVEELQIRKGFPLSQVDLEQVQTMYRATPYGARTKKKMWAVVDVIWESLQNAARYSGDAAAREHAKQVGFRGGNLRQSMREELTPVKTRDQLKYNIRRECSAYFLFDRKDQLAASDNVSEFSFSIVNEGFGGLSNTGIVRTSARLRNITRIKTMPFRFPSTLRSLNSTSIVSLRIREIANQAYFANNTMSQYLFLMALREDSSHLTAQDLGFRPTEVHFYEPIASLESITLSFGNPLQVLSFDPDRATATVTASGADTLLTFAMPHKLAIGEVVTISHFTTSSPVVDRLLIDEINNEFGHVLTVVTASTATFALDISGLVGTLEQADVYFESKRFLVPMEFIYIDSVE